MEKCIVQIQSVRVNFVCPKRLLNLSAEENINVRISRLCDRCAILLLKIERIPSSCHLVKGFENSPKSIQDVIGDVYCPGGYCLKREKCGFLDGNVTTPRSIYGYGKCGAWLFVHKVHFMLQEHVTTTKTDKTRLLFARKVKFVTRQTIVH